MRETMEGEDKQCANKKNFVKLFVCTCRDRDTGTDTVTGTAT